MTIRGVFLLGRLTHRQDGATRREERVRTWIRTLEASSCIDVRRGPRNADGVLRDQPVVSGFENR
jgi:hypothetical protein